MSDSFVAPWTVAHQAHLSMGFPRKEYWNRLPFPTPGDLPNPGIKPASFSSPALAGGLCTMAPLGKPESESQSVVSDSLQPHGLQSMDFSRPEYRSG